MRAAPEPWDWRNREGAGRARTWMDGPWPVLPSSVGYADTFSRQAGEGTLLTQQPVQPGLDGLQLAQGAGQAQAGVVAQIAGSGFEIA